MDNSQNGYSSVEKTGKIKKQYFVIIKCSEKNKMDNSKNNYNSVEKTGKIKKTLFFQELQMS